MTGELATAGEVDTFNLTATVSTLVVGDNIETITLLVRNNIGANAGATTIAHTMTGNSGNNVLTGGSLADTITGNAGNDFITGNGGSDNITGGDGNDSMSGDDSNDPEQRQWRRYDQWRRR
ncbi:MAG: hypothetical protein IPN42_19230 [Methylococcaceae bacterium]|nr:hypothetical protein [Methylococcaceae bacterium]